MNTKYPKWFYPTSQPGYKPSPPSETVFQYKELHSLVAYDYDYQDFTQLPEGTNSVTVRIDRDYYDDHVSSVSLVFAEKKEIPNPNYAKLYKVYEERLAEHKKQVEEWEVWKKIWDEEQEVKDKEQRLKTYKKLKKEFEPLRKEFED